MDCRTGKEAIMTAEERKLGTRWFEEVWNQGRRDLIPQLMAPEGVIHDGEVDTVGAENFYPFYDRIRAAFPDIHITVHDVVAEGDRMCVRWSFAGTHTGEGLGLPPTGRKVEATGMSLLRVAGGRLAEGWQNWDMLGLMEQLRAAGKSATYI